MLETFNISLQISMDVKVKVIVDSCGDIPDDILKRYDIGMVPLNIELGELLRDRVDISPQEYYAKIYEYNLPNTSSRCPEYNLASVSAVCVLRDIISKTSCGI